MQTLFTSNSGMGDWPFPIKLLWKPGASPATRLLMASILLTMMSVSAHSQTTGLEVAGRVSDERGEGLPGVNVTVKGTNRGTVTDVNGGYTILADNSSTTLVFSFVGFTSQEILVGNRTNIDVTLATDVKGLSEVVVVGYGTQKKVNLTGAVTAVNAGELVNMTASNLSNTLAGRAPGVNVTNTSGLAGATSKIRMRGAFGEPLFVIDGIVRDKQAFDALEAGEVDQMSFLKDAATAAIYGSRAGNGVVLITTKKGGKSKPVFNLQ